MGVEGGFLAVLKSGAAFALSKVAPFLFASLVIRVSDAGVYGLLAGGIALLAFGAQITGLGMQTYLPHLVARHGYVNTKSLLAANAHIAVGIGALSFIFGTSISALRLTDLPFDSNLAVGLFALCMFLYTCFQIVSSTFIGLGLAWLSQILSGLIFFLALGLVVLAAWVMGFELYSYTLEVLFLATSISAIASVLCFYLVRSGHVVGLSCTAFADLWPFYGNQIFAVGGGVLFLFIAASLLDPNEFAMVQLHLMLAGISGLMAQVLNPVVSPYRSRLSLSGDWQAVRRLGRLTMASCFMWYLLIAIVLVQFYVPIMNLWAGGAVDHRPSLLFVFLLAFGVRSAAGGLGAHLLMTGFGKHLIPYQFGATSIMLTVIACSSLVGAEPISSLLWGFCCFF